MPQQVKITEDMLQVYTKDLLDLRAAPGVVYFHVPNESALPVQWGVKMKAHGVLGGVADWIILLPAARAAFLELKRPKQGKSRGGVQGANQLRFARDVTALGFEYYLADTPEDIEAALEIMGALAANVNMRRAA